MRYTGRAQVDPTHPESFGVCDRCGFWWNLNRLRYQFEWSGTQLYNTRLRVCPPCTDVPFVFRRAQIFPPDPVPVNDPRPQNFQVANNGSPTVPPLPWPVQAQGAPSASHPPYPVYVTPPDPPLPPDLQWTFSEP